MHSAPQRRLAVWFGCLRTQTQPALLQEQCPDALPWRCEPLWRLGEEHAETRASLDNSQHIKGREEKDNCCSQGVGGLTARTYAVGLCRDAEAGVKCT